MEIKRIIALFLAILTLALPLMACKKGDDEDGGGSSVSTTLGEGEERYYLDTIRQDAYGIENLNILAHNVTHETYEESETAGSEFVAIYNRDMALKERYGVEISYSFLDISATKALADIRKDANGGMSEYHFINYTPESLAIVALEGILADMTTVENLDFSRSWWSESFNKNMTIQGKLYFAGGMWSRLYFHLPTAVAFNKRHIDSMGIGADGIYKMVTDGTWTLAEMKKICTDYNMTDVANEQYMICPAEDNMYMTFGCVGGHYSSIDVNDNITVDLATDFALDRIDALISLFDHSYTDHQKIFDTIPVFTEGRATFSVVTVGVMYEYKKYDVDYGIVPFPKYDLDQKDYISTAACNSNFAVAVPASLDGDVKAFAGLMLEAMTFLSLDIVKPVKYDNVLAYQVAQDENTSEIVLDTIFNSLYFDANLAFNFGGSRDLIGNTINSGTSGQYMSTMKFNSGIIKDAISKYNQIG